MITRISLAAIAALLGACASSGPETPAPASVETVATETAPAEGEIYDLDAPNVEQAAAVTPDDDADEIICRRETITGTRMSHRVCRRRADMESMEEDGQEALRKMRQTGSQLEKGIAN